MECGGLCAATLNCDTFYFKNEECYLLDAKNLYVNEGDTQSQDVYMLNDSASENFFIISRLCHLSSSSSTSVVKPTAYRFRSLNNVYRPS